MIQTCPICFKKVDTTFGNYCEHCGFDFATQTIREGSDPLDGTSLQFMLDTLEHHDPLHPKERFTGNPRKEDMDFQDDIIEYEGPRNLHVRQCDTCGINFETKTEISCPECRRQAIFFKWKDARSRLRSGKLFLAIGLILSIGIGVQVMLSVFIPLFLPLTVLLIIGIFILGIPFILAGMGTIIHSKVILKSINYWNISFFFFCCIFSGFSFGIFAILTSSLVLSNSWGSLATDEILDKSRHIAHNPNLASWTSNVQKCLGLK